MSTTVRDVMTTRVVALRADAGFKDIVMALRRNRVSACPVIDQAGKVIGVVSEADLIAKQIDPPMPTGLTRLAWRLAAEGKATALTADQLMTAPAITIQPGLPAKKAARVMQDRQVKRLPVVTADGKLIGIVTRSDVLSVFERPDGDIWDEVVKVILAEDFGVDPDTFDVVVSSGVVTIGGQLDHRATALRMLGEIRHSEGVVGVRNRLSYPVEE